MGDYEEACAPAAATQPVTPGGEKGPDQPASATSERPAPAASDQPAPAGQPTSQSQPQPASAAQSAAASAQLAAWREAVFAAAAHPEGSFASADPRAHVPVALRPGSHSVQRAYVWLGVLVPIGALVAVLVAALGDAFMGMLLAGGFLLFEDLIVAAATGALAVIAAVALIVYRELAWRHISYELSPTELTVRSGILNKKRKHIPYQRVQAVNQQAGLLQRLLGLCNVKIDTAGGAVNDAAEIEYLSKADAEALRAELFRRKKVLLAGGEIDAFGNVFIDGGVVPSAWMIACTGGSEASAYVALGVEAPPASTQPAPTQPSPAAPAQPVAPQQPAFAAATAVPQQPSRPTNVLDAADSVLGEVYGIFGGASAPTGRVRFETGLTNKELVFAGLSSSVSPAAAASIIVIVCAILQFALDFLLFAFEGTGMAEPSAAGLADTLMLVCVLVAAIVIGGLIIAWVISVLVCIVQYGGFRARRRENRIEVERGLFSRTFSGVDVDRVQGVVIEQGFIRRIMGYCEIRLLKVDPKSSEQTESTNASMAGMVVHPFVKLSRASEIMAGLVPEFADAPTIAVRPAPVALRRAIVRRGVLRSVAFWVGVTLALTAACVFALAGAGVLYVEPAALAIVRTCCIVYLVFYVVVLVVHIIDARIWHRDSGLGYDERFMRIFNGGLKTREVVLPRRKIQYAFTRTNPLQRAAHVSTVSVRSAAGFGGTTESLWDVPEAAADAYLQWTRPGHYKEVPQ